MKPRLAMFSLLLFAAGVFFVGINWGLPSSDVNHYLFGSHSIWTGEQIIKLAGAWDSNADVGADIDRNPLQGRDKTIWLNQTDAQRAEIVRRYRLFSYQPDEMITLRALSQMNPTAGRLDPKLYQYGGLWMYPVGAMLKLGSIAGIVHLTGDLAYYLDHPEAFGRFYVVARAYSALWGIVGVIAVWWIVRKLTANEGIAFFAGVAFIVMPVVVCMSHEAKPHLAGAVLMLLATLAAMRFIDTGRMRDAIFTGVLCGAAFGMILSSLPIFIVIPAMTLMRPETWPRRICVTILATAIGGAVYLATNPYVLINGLFHRELFFSNVGNYGKFYSITDVPAGVWNAIRLTFEGAGYVFAIGGVAAWLMLHFSPPLLRRKLILLALPAMCMFGQFALLAAGKPGEYGRFLILPDVVLMIGVAVAAGSQPVKPNGLPIQPQRQMRVILVGVLTAITAIGGSAYLRGFVNDSHAAGTRAILADQLNAAQPMTITLYAEPAPYCLPPVNLFGTRLLLAPAGTLTPTTESDCVVFAVDRAQTDVGFPGFAGRVVLHYTTPISWADKPFMIRTRISNTRSTPQ